MQIICITFLRDIEKWTRAKYNNSAADNYTINVRIHKKAQFCKTRICKLDFFVYESVSFVDKFENVQF